MAIKIGPYVLSHPTQGKIWINKTDEQTAEGGRFDVAELEELLDRLWAERY